MYIEYVYIYIYGMIFASLGSMFIHLYPIYNQHIIWLSSLCGKKTRPPVGICGLGPQDPGIHWSASIPFLVAEVRDLRPKSNSLRVKTRFLSLPIRCLADADLPEATGPNGGTLRGYCGSCHLFFGDNWRFKQQFLCDLMSTFCLLKSKEIQCHLLAMVTPPQTVDIRFDKQLWWTSTVNFFTCESHSEFPRTCRQRIWGSESPMLDSMF